MTDDAVPIRPPTDSQLQEGHGDLDHTEPIDALYMADRLRTKRKLPTPFHYDERCFPGPTANACKLQLVAHDSYRLPQAIQQPVYILLTLSWQYIKFLEGLQKRIDPVIAEAMRPIPRTLDTIPGLGLVYSACIANEIGDVARFDYD